MQPADSADDITEMIAHRDCFVDCALVASYCLQRFAFLIRLQFMISSLMHRQLNPPNFAKFLFSEIACLKTNSIP